ncbi:MAG: hypothetical protein HY517_01985 [Candidatus Aenigmarchaeota archaeon]|nr:hypothetical protein [Candidatus Aenigmarchaeota archaeon]
MRNYKPIEPEKSFQWFRRLDRAACNILGPLVIPAALIGAIEYYGAVYFLNTGQSPAQIEQRLTDVSRDLTEISRGVLLPVYIANDLTRPIRERAYKDFEKIRQD